MKDWFVSPCDNQLGWGVVREELEEAIVMQKGDCCLSSPMPQLVHASSDVSKIEAGHRDSREWIASVWATSTTNPSEFINGQLMLPHAQPFIFVYISPNLSVVDEQAVHGLWALLHMGVLIELTLVQASVKATCLKLVRD